jgi:spore coat protein A
MTTYVYHCHLLEHEDHEMLRPFVVLKEDFEKFIVFEEI